MATGHLVANCGVNGGTTWIVQTSDDPQSTFGHDAVLYFSFLYPFYGVQRETVGAAVLARSRLIRQLDAFAGLHAPRIGALAQDAHGFLWIGSPAGIERFDGQDR
ncbi:MAG TPA: hypothetical protein VHT91_05370 [Kofleriaceae bacterium]|jgi:hypothetical protein|nr:hypothetical protein [Kofleriaceae bacterium]